MNSKCPKCGEKIQGQRIHRHMADYHSEPVEYSSDKTYPTGECKCCDHLVHPYIGHCRHCPLNEYLLENKEAPEPSPSRVAETTAWEEDFDSQFMLNPLGQYYKDYPTRDDRIKAFIKTNFVPKKQVLEALERFKEAEDIRSEITEWLISKDWSKGRAQALDDAIALIKKL